MTNLLIHGFRIRVLRSFCLAFALIPCKFARKYQVKKAEIGRATSKFSSFFNFALAKVLFYPFVCVGWIFSGRSVAEMADSDFRRQSCDLISFWQIEFSGKSNGYVGPLWTAVIMAQTSGLDPSSSHHFYILQM